MWESLLLLVWSISTWDESLLGTSIWSLVSPWCCLGAAHRGKTEAGTELGHGGSYKRQEFGQQEAHTQRPHLQWLLAPPSLEELLSGPGGTPELVVGTFVPPLNPPSKCEAEHLALVCIALPSSCCCGRALASG